jgi:hypothetical protein
MRPNFRIFISLAAWLKFNLEPGCLVKDKTRPKTDPLVCSQLTIKYLILFKV